MIQTRNTEGACEEHFTLDEAFKHAEEGDPTVWKISFSRQGERIRLIRTVEGWLYEDPLGNRRNGQRVTSESTRMYTEARGDLAKVIAQETSGLRTAVPEESDFEMADHFIDIISSRKDL